MQTFLPSADFRESARVLDSRRLGKQRLEATQIHRALTSDGPYGWRSHPATKMWRGCEQALACYGLIVCLEWITRGYRDSLGEYFYSSFDDLTRARISRRDLSAIRMPSWLGDERVHASHRSQLLGKEPEHYGQFGWTEEPGLPYHWPETNTLGEWSKIIMER